MADKNIITKVADIPLARPGFETLGTAAPTLVQMNPGGQWAQSKPSCLDEERLIAIVQQLIKSNAVSPSNTYCTKCAAENKIPGMQSNYIPVIMMPVYSADQCPFDMQCETNETKPVEAKKSQKGGDGEGEKKSKKNERPKKRGFIFTRFKDFDLNSQCLTTFSTLPFILAADKSGKTVRHQSFCRYMKR